jgi:hypothetical protein
MELHKRIRVGLTNAIKNKSDTVTDLRYILGEFSRLKGTKDGKAYIGDTLTDEQAIRVLTGIIAGETKLLEIVKEATSTLTPLCESYLPKKASRQELLEFITTIDFDGLKNNMEAIGITKKHFGTAADGKLIMDIVKNI